MERNTTTISREDIARQMGHCHAVAQINAQRPQPPLAFVDTYGCQQNEADSERIRGYLQEMGYGFTQDEEQADVIVINTCAIREHAEQRVLGNLGALVHVKRRHPGQLICLCGCMAQEAHVAQKVKESYRHVDLVFGPQVLWRFPEFIHSLLTARGRVFQTPDLPGSIAEGIPVVRQDKVKAWVSIMYGCNNFCSYCIVPYTRGRERSRSAESILAELADLRAKGFREATLLGQNVNSYRYETASGEVIDFARLLAMVADAAPEMRIRFTTSHPKDMSDEIIAVIASKPNVCKHIHLPVQSGSDKVLKAMNRKYTREWYLGRIAAIRRAIPDCGISTDLFTGFHDETEEDFLETLSLMEEVGFDSAFMFKYSERPGTLAARTMPDNIPEEVKIDRLNRMIAVQNELSRKSNARDVGKTFDVLVEGVSKRSREQFVGRNQQNKTLVFPRGDYRVGDTVRVRVVDSSSATLIGELV